MSKITQSRIDAAAWDWLCKGRIVVAEFGIYRPKLKRFIPRFAPMLRKGLLKTKRGVFFKSREAALEAGQMCLKQMRKQ